MKAEASRDKLNNRMHRHGTEWFVGDGATVEFRLSKNYDSLDDIEVYVAGSLKRPDDSGTAHDYSVRGVTAGYAGDKNAITFAVAPALNAAVAVRIVST